MYLLNDLGIRKPDVAHFWAQQPFDLELADYEGNCKLCHKKSKRKLLTQIDEHPEDAVWLLEMEEKYDQICPPNAVKSLPMRFFRENDSIRDLMDEAALPFDRAIDQSKDTTGRNPAADFNADMDYEDADCGSSCEPFAAMEPDDEEF